MYTHYKHYEWKKENIECGYFKKRKNWTVLLGNACAIGEMIKKSKEMITTKPG